MKLTPRFEAQLLESATLAGKWYINNQNNEKHPWGGVHNSADNGRFIYEYFPATGQCRGGGVWAQAVAIMGFLTMVRGLRYGGGEFRDPAILAGEYLKTLQVLDKGHETNYGGLREHTPQEAFSLPRDAATGGMGFIALYRETGEEEYLQRAMLFAEWYHRYGSNEKGWPYYQFDFKTGTGGKPSPAILDGDWQAGGALVYYWLYKLTGDKKWLEYFMQIVALLMELHANAQAGGKGFHGETQISSGNDDFSIAVLLSAYRETKDKKILATVQKHVRRLWTLMDEDGSYPAYAGTFVSNFNNIEYLQLCREENIAEDIPALEERILKTLKFGLTLQELSPRDVRAYGGFYGQSEYGVSRNHIHHRDAGYSIILHMRVAGGTETPYFSAWHWDNVKIPKPANPA